MKADAGEATAKQPLTGRGISGLFSLCAGLFLCRTPAQHRDGARFPAVAKVDRPLTGQRLRDEGCSLVLCCCNNFITRIDTLLFAALVAIVCCGRRLVDHATMAA